MYRTKDTDLAGNAPVAVTTLTKADKFRIAASGYDVHLEDIFFGMEQIEYRPGQAIRNTPTIGGPLQPAIDALKERGVATGENVGDFMDALDMTNPELHAIACGCNGDEVSGAELKTRFLDLVDG